MYRAPNTSRLASWLAMCARRASIASQMHAATVATNTKSMPATHASTTARQNQLRIMQRLQTIRRGIIVDILTFLTICAIIITGMRTNSQKVRRNKRR
jgi:hypothetical protein